MRLLYLLAPAGGAVVRGAVIVRLLYLLAHCAHPPGCSIPNAARIRAGSSMVCMASANVALPATTSPAVALIW